MRAKQTVLVSKKLAPGRSAAAKVAKRHGDRVYTSRETKNYWRFRQRPPSCFGGTFKTESRAGGKILVVYGMLKKGAQRSRSCR